MPHNPEQQPIEPIESTDPIEPTPPISSERPLYSMNPREVVDKIYGPPVKEGQRKLEDFRKQGIPKPEKLKSLTQEITAKNKEGREVVFNLEEIRQEWIIFYRNINLSELAEEMETIDFNLTSEQIELLQEKSEQGFDKLILLPSIELQEQHLQRIKEETEKELKRLPANQQYDEKEGTHLSETIRPNFPDKITTKNRETTQSKPYFVFLKDTPEVDQETLGKTPDQLRKIFKQNKETGLTLFEYLVFQRDYTEKHQNDEKPHPETQKYSYLLDSELSPNSSTPGRVVGAGWLPDFRRVRVGSYSSGRSFPDGGARSSAILEII